MSETNFESFTHDDNVTKYFAIATIVWAVVGMLVGVIIATQLADWRFNFGIEWLTFGRLRPLHTNAVIFAFVGNGVFAGIYYSTPRLLKTRMFSDILSRIHFWGWQAIIVVAIFNLLLGFSHGKEYAELEWPVDLAITVIWVVFAVNFFGTLFRRREKHIYVSIWFYISAIVSIAVLHIVNSLEMPVSLMKSYPIFAGVQDALIQWWYGHNAVAFFLTTPVLGLMYYFVPKVVKQPVYSYRLSIIHFWSLVFIYIWAGPHHLLYSSLPDWVQTVGMVFSVALVAPSWGGMINGLLTMRGKWDEVRSNPILKMFALSITFYGMSTLEGPILSIKSVNYIGHYTDWIIGHVHSGTLGWNAFLLAAMLYYMVPKLWKTNLYSVKLANFHFWLGTIGIILYIISMWTAGITQGLMWRALDFNGNLVYPDFVETVTKISSMYWVRAGAGVLFLLGFILMAFNIFKTIAEAPKDTKEEVFKALPLVHSKYAGDTGHRKLEGLTAVFVTLSFLAISVGSVIELLPAMLADDYIEKNPAVKPYTPLELAGRDIYIAEGCYVCHSQQIRQSAEEQIRYGKISEAADSVYHRPFQWGSRRIGPDLARVGKNYPDLWHYRHMIDPREVTPNSIMPVYTWLVDKKAELEILKKKLSVMKALGVPYSDEEIENAVSDAKKQAAKLAKKLNDEGNIPMSIQDKQIVALIAYLQRLGTDTDGEE